MAAWKIQMQKTKGFTLIELLVVIAVIAVLMSILMPALKAARDHGKRVHCLKNAKTLSLGWYMYALDNDNKLVGGNNGEGHWVLRPMVTSTLEERLEKIRNGLLFKYVGESVDVYQCPADFRIKITKYDAVRTYSIAGGANGGLEDLDFVTSKTLSDIRRPSEKYVFLEEVDERGFNMGTWIIGFDPERFKDALGDWHKGRSTLGYADGHANVQRWVDNSFRKWINTATYNPDQFVRGLTPSPDERTDYDFLAQGFPYKSRK
jgi:prepilin-type N-terminal cleavage/methylation domain-containing protein/prepilin-type processing-associated H-X9-DG protein